MAEDPNELISVTLTRTQWDELDRQASLYLGAACCDDPALETIRAALNAGALNEAGKRDDGQ